VDWKKISNEKNSAYVQYKGNFVLGKIVGKGSFGTVYIGTDISTGGQLVIKEEDETKNLLGSEAAIYKNLSDGFGIPKYHSFLEEGKYKYLALERLGPCLNDLFSYQDQTFSLKTVLMISDQMV
jgi:serine/threonine protein kinase